MVSIGLQVLRNAHFEDPKMDEIARSKRAQFLNLSHLSIAHFETPKMDEITGRIWGFIALEMAIFGNQKRAERVARSENDQFVEPLTH